MKKDLTYITRNGYSIQLTVYGIDLPVASPIVVYMHGFKGFKDWGFAPPTGEFFRENGYRFIAFNFSHNGIGENPVEFTELEKFKNNTFSLEVVEAMEIVEMVRRGEFFEVAPEARLGVIGHSRGGGVALLATSKSTHIDAVTTWAAISTFNRYGPEILTEWADRGYMEVKNSRTGQVFQLGMPLLQDLLAHRYGFLNVHFAVRNMITPMCIVHGDQDDAVAPSNAHHLLEWSNRNEAELHIIPGANHVFNARHPFEGVTPELENAWKHTLKFFGSTLNK